MPTPRKYGPAIHARLVEEVRRSGFKAIAARCAGIHKDTFEDWLQAGAKALRGDPEGDPAYAKLYLDVEAARGDVGRDLAELNRNLSERVPKEEGTGHPQAAQWALERMFPKECGPSTRTQVQLGGDPDGTPIKVEGDYERARRLMADDATMAAANLIAAAMNGSDDVPDAG